MSRRRQIRQQQRTALREHRREVARVMATAESDPGWQALQVRRFDDEVAEVVRRDRPGQVDRLIAAGYVQRRQAEDGCGIWDHRRRMEKIIHSVFREDDGEIWAHTSVSDAENRLPAWQVMRDAQWVLYPHRAGIVVVAPPSQHVAVSEVLHVWTCLSAEPVPDFRKMGVI